jgi:hypothetical protein
MFHNCIPRNLINNKKKKKFKFLHGEKKRKKGSTFEIAKQPGTVEENLTKYSPGSFPFNVRTADSELTSPKNQLRK